MVFAHSTVHVVVVDAALVLEDGKWVELVVGQGAELQIVEVVHIVVVEMDQEAGLVHVVENHLGQTADQVVVVEEDHCCMVELHPWVELVVVQEEADCNDMVDFADSVLEPPSTPVD